MYDSTHPAQNIQELINYLESIHNDKVVYRGQNKDYDSLVPSFYRNKLSSTRYDKHSKVILSQYNKYNHFIKYNSDMDNEVNIAKRITMNHLMGGFGKSLGNVIAQQYGINSECLDVTSDPHVAAFFATHLWPEYNTVVNSSELGIIYRIHCMGDDDDSMIQHAGIELMLSSHYLLEDSEPIPLLFSSARYQHTDKEFDELNEKYNFVVRKTISRPVLINNLKLKDIVYTYYNDKYPEIDIESLYDATRINKQKAGFFIPSFGFDSYVPSKLEVKNIYNIKAYSPSFVIQKEKVLIEDILAYPKIEKYYFYHDKDVESTYTREDLWPSRDKDYFFDLLYRWCSDGCKKYLDKLHINIDDREKGILDRGYYDIND